MPYEDPYKDIDDLDEIDVELEKERPLWQKVLFRSFKIIIGLAVVAGLIYLSGFREFFFYRRTPDMRVETMESVLQEEEMELPLSAKIIKAEESTKGSERTVEGILDLTKKANKIWAQADVVLKVGEVEKVSMSEQELEKFSDSPSGFVRESEDFDSSRINVFFIGNLEGPSGIAYTGSDNILIADYTTAHDYLVFAHEVGHVLGLDHVNASNRLMSTDANGPKLTKKEIKKARNTAEVITKN